MRSCLKENYVDVRLRVVFEGYSDITNKERECKDYKGSKHKMKYEVIADLRKTDISCELREHSKGNDYDFSHPC